MTNTVLVFIVLFIMLFGALLGMALGLISIRKQKRNGFILLDDFC